MMTPWSRLCFLVLVISSLARGQNETAHDKNPVAVTDHPNPSSETPGRLAPTQTPNQAKLATETDPATNISTSFNNQTKPPETDNPGSPWNNNKTEEGNGNKTAQATTTAGATEGEKKPEPADVQSTVSTMTLPQTTQQSVVVKGSSSSNNVGYVVLVLIIIVIIVLCVILYFLRRVSRSYSFDLQRPVHNHLDEPTGTFEPVYLDDLDITAPRDQMTTDDLSPPPAANGTTVQSEENASNGDNAPQEQPETNGVEISLTSNTSPSLDNDPADKTPSPLSTSNLFLDATGEEQQNENNNNPSVCSSDPFVEINLDDPAWSDQLLTSPEASSSVLPFSPFSFSSSSS